jgi:hypothetical protein
MLGLYRSVVRGAAQNVVSNATTIYTVAQQCYKQSANMFHVSAHNFKTGRAVSPSNKLLSTFSGVYNEVFPLAGLVL